MLYGLSVGNCDHNRICKVFFFIWEWPHSRSITNAHQPSVISRSVSHWSRHIMLPLLRLITRYSDCGLIINLSACPLHDNLPFIWFMPSNSNSRRHLVRVKVSCEWNSRLSSHSHKLALTLQGHFDPLRCPPPVFQCWFATTPTTNRALLTRLYPHHQPRPADSPLPPPTCQSRPATPTITTLSVPIRFYSHHNSTGYDSLRTNLPVFGRWVLVRPSLYLQYGESKLLNKRRDTIRLLLLT